MASSNIRRIVERIGYIIVIIGILLVVAIGSTNYLPGGLNASMLALFLMGGFFMAAGSVIVRMAPVKSEKPPAKEAVDTLKLDDDEMVF